MKPIFLLYLSATALFGQATFEVASVKPSDPDARGGNFLFVPGGGVHIQNGTLQRIIEMAYDMRHFQVVGGPGWLNNDRYDIEAKAAFGQGPPKLSMEQVQTIRQKLQALLAERFQLKVHRDTRELPIFAMVVAKTGAKLTDAVAGQSRTGIQMDCGKMIGRSATMLNFVNVLSNELERPVRDQTGLPGAYDFKLEWTPDEGPCHKPDDPVDGPSIFTAMPQQLGLKLESTKGPVEIIVIDHVEKAEGN